MCKQEKTNPSHYTNQTNATVNKALLLTWLKTTALYFSLDAIKRHYLGKHSILPKVFQPYPIQGLFEAVEPVLSGQSVLSEVHCVRDVGWRVLQQRQINQLPLQAVHLQHVKLDTANRHVDTRSVFSFMSSQWSLNSDSNSSRSIWKPFFWK